MNVGPTELMILLFMALLAVVPIVALVDAARQPREAWERAGQNQTVWIVLNAVRIVACGFGLIIGLVYLIVVRPKVAAR